MKKEVISTDDPTSQGEKALLRDLVLPLIRLDSEVPNGYWLLKRILGMKTEFKC